jgi:hypothetical protein
VDEWSKGVVRRVAARFVHCWREEVARGKGGRRWRPGHCTEVRQTASEQRNGREGGGGSGSEGDTRRRERRGGPVGQLITWPAGAGNGRHGVAERTGREQGRSTREPLLLWARPKRTVIFSIYSKEFQKEVT